MMKQKKSFTLMSKKENKQGFFKRSASKKFIEIPVEGFETEVIRTTDKRYKTVIKVTDPVNLDLLDNKGKIKAINSVQDALNAHNTGQRCQILISSDEIDINQYLQELNEKAAGTFNPEKVNLIRGKQEFLQDHSLKARNGHNFYVVLESSEKDYSEAIAALYDLSKNVIEHIKRGGMNAIRLKEEAVKEIVYNKLTPSSHETQPYEPNMDLTAWQPPDIKGGDVLTMDDTHYRFFTFSYFPKEVTAGWLDGVMNARVNLDISITLESTDKGDQVTKVDGQIKELNTRLLNKLPSSLRRKYETEVKSLERLLDRMQDDSENLFNTTFILAVREKGDLKKLESSCKRLETQIKSSRMKSKRIGNNSGLIWYTLPLGYENKDVEKRYSWQMYSELIGSMVPFNSAEMNYNTGILEGFNVKSEAPVIYDSWDRSKFNNNNCAILGESGSGKSFLVKLRIYREYYAGRAKRQFIIDPEREYGIIPGANVIYFKPGSVFVTNPFHIRSTVVDSDDHKTDSSSIRDYLPRKISGLVSFFKWIISDMQPLELSVMFDCIQQAYERCGLPLNQDIKELPHLFPTLGTLDEILAERGKDAERIRAILKPYVNGVYSGIFNGQTNWNLDAEINVLDIHEMDTALQKPMMDLLLKELWEEVKKDRNEHVGLIADELWILSDENNPQAMQFMRDMAKRIRKYKGFLCVATQNVADFLSVGKYGTAIINASQIKTFMRLQENDVKVLEREITSFSEGEKAILSGSKPQGYCLHLIKTKRVEMRTVITPEEQKTLNLSVSYGEAEEEEREVLV